MPVYWAALITFTVALLDTSSYSVRIVPSAFYLLMITTGQTDLNRKHGTEYGNDNFQNTDNFLPVRCLAAH
jgi:hypothetical protein